MSLVGWQCLLCAQPSRPGHCIPHGIYARHQHVNRKADWFVYSENVPGGGWMLKSWQVLSLLEGCLVGEKQGS